MKNELTCQRCFTIPRAKLDLFLTALHVNFSDRQIEHRMEYVFINEDAKFYDVIVNVYGSSPYMDIQLKRFVEMLSPQQTERKA